MMVHKTLPLGQSNFGVRKIRMTKISPFGNLKHTLMHSLYIFCHLPGTPKQPRFVETVISHVKIWFIIQLKQPVKNSRLGFQVCSTCSSHELFITPRCGMIQSILSFFDDLIKLRKESSRVIPSYPSSQSQLPPPFFLHDIPNQNATKQNSAENTSRNSRWKI